MSKSALASKSAREQEIEAERKRIGFVPDRITVPKYYMPMLMREEREIGSRFKRMSSDAAAEGAKPKIPKRDEETTNIIFATWIFILAVIAVMTMS